ncbi:MAG: hypothetical protein KAH21_09845 [Spirochaetaceae bacterium]|nr:hypothetical protein [Spirochaetaceae bacterium]
MVRIIGVALEGQQGMPVVVFDDPENGDFLTVSVDPFDAEILIRDYIGEAEHSAAAWLGDFLKTSPPRRGIIEKDDGGTFLIKLEFGILRSVGLKRDRVLPFGEGLMLLRRLSIPLYADELLFDTSREELTFLTESNAFGGEFLYLTPEQYTSIIPG